MKFDIKSAFLSLVWAILWMVMLFSFSDCANQMAPTGGPKDTLSPFLVNSIPRNQGLNYRGDIVIIEFNEWIRENGLRQELLITPPTRAYRQRIVKNRVEIRFDSLLLENTTYSLNFRQGIEDITEGNIAVIDTITDRPLKLAFSTGEVIDTMSIQGNVRNLLTHLPVEKAVVSLYSTEDTLRYDEDRPYYFTISDEEGNFLMENIKAGKYRLYAIKDRNNDLSYQEPEPLAFIPDTVVLGDTTVRLENVSLEVAPEDHTAPELIRDKAVGDYYEIEFSEGLADYLVEPLGAYSGDSLVYDLTNKGKTLRLYNLQAVFDSIPLLLELEDSLGNRSEEEIKIAFREPSERDKKKATTASSPLRVDIQSEDELQANRPFTIHLQFDKPVASYDLEKLIYILDQDSLTLAPLTYPDSTQEYRWNRTRSRLTLTKSFPLQESVKIILDTAAFISIEQDSSRFSSKSFNRKDPSNFGSISGKVISSETDYIVQLLRDGKNIVGERVNASNFDFTFLPAGQYSIRVILDKNGNKRWDGSDVAENQPPEPILYFTLPNEGKLREKWDIQDVVIEF